MNILLITSLYPFSDGPYKPGGTWALHNMVKFWQQREGVQVQVINPNYIYLSELLGIKKTKRKKTLRIKRFFLDQVPVTVFPIFKLPRIAYLYSFLYRYLDRYLKKISFTPDVVVAEYDKGLEMGYGYARRWGFPFVAGFHIAPDLWYGHKEAFVRRSDHLLAEALGIACRSPIIYKRIQQWYPQYENKSFIVYSGIEESAIDALENGLKRLRQWKAPIPTETGKPSVISIMTVCGLVKSKQVHTILIVLAKLQEINWTYTVIGKGEERHSLEALAEQLGIRGRVTFTGLQTRQEVLAHLKRAHIFIMVSHMETFGMVYHEAMASGNLVIGTKGEGIDGFINDGENGFLLPAGEVEQLKNLLEAIIYQFPLEKLELILKNAHETMTNCTDEKTSDDYFKQLEEVICVA
jgi:L-malate glycosyltransferase